MCVVSEGRWRTAAAAAAADKQVQYRRERERVARHAKTRPSNPPLAVVMTLQPITSLTAYHHHPPPTSIEVCCLIPSHTRPRVHHLSIQTRQHAIQLFTHDSPVHHHACVVRSTHQPIADFFVRPNNPPSIRPPASCKLARRHASSPVKGTYNQGLLMSRAGQFLTLQLICPCCCCSEQPLFRPRRVR